jgi:hypothetical protein
MNSELGELGMYFLDDDGIEESDVKEVLWHKLSELAQVVKAPTTGNGRASIANSATALMRYLGGAKVPKNERMQRIERERFKVEFVDKRERRN